MNKPAETISAGRSDGELLTEFMARKDEPAFAEIVRRHGGMVVGACRSVLGNTQDAEDAAQAVFLTLAQRASSLRNRTTLAGWLYRVAWYVAARAGEAKAIRRRHEQEAVRMKPNDLMPENEAIPLDMLHAALADLPEKYRLPLLLHHLEGRSEEETASLLGCSRSAASMRLARGRQRLRTGLAKRGVAAPAVGVVAVMASQASAGVTPVFVNSASQVAVAVLAGKTATAAASASVAAFSKGAINMLFWANVKLAAMVMAATLLVGGTGVATYVVAAEKSASPPAIQPAATAKSPTTTSAPATGNDLPWGAAVEGVQVRLRAAATQPVSSKPFEKDGLQVTVNLAKATFAADEPLKFTVQFKNVSKNSFVLNDVDWFWGWTIQFRDEARDGPWQLHLLVQPQPPLLAPRLCKPGETVEVTVDLGKDGLPHDFRWEGRVAGQAVLPLKQLHPGKYRLTMDIPLKASANLSSAPVEAPFWTGTIQTEPVELEVSDEAAATQAAAETLQWKAGETPTLLADVRNQGTRDSTVARSSRGFGELEIDGLWYYGTIVELLIGSDFGPGKEYTGIAYTLDTNWQTEQGGILKQRSIVLKLAPGKHTVRVALTAQPTKNEEKAVRAISNAVEIEILPADGAKLDPATEEKLQWGKPVNGLRAALMIRPAPGGPKEGGTPDLYLVVQNVSKAPIHLDDTKPLSDKNVPLIYDADSRMANNFEEPHRREVYITLYGKDAIDSVQHIDNRSTLTDVMLQPREVAFLLMFAPDAKNPVGHSSGSIIAEEARADPHATLVAVMKIEQAPAGAWTGKLVTPETTGAVAAGAPQPKDGHAQALYKLWQANARTDGTIPGALVGQLGETVKLFISDNKEGSPPVRDMSLKFEKLLPRFDVSRDWTPSDSIALLDDISTIHSMPLEATLEAVEYNVIRSGKPLPAELADAPWGQPSPDGLRVAWLLEPRAKEYPLGTALQSRILAHNSGKETVIFIMPSRQIFAGHTAHDANGDAIKINGTTRGMSGISIVSKMTYRLAPGEYCEAPAVSIGVGPQTDENVVKWHIASWIDAKPGGEVRFSPGAVGLRCSEAMVGARLPSVRPFVGIKDAAELWSKIIAERVERELPLPAAAAEREPIIRRVTLDLFGGEPTPEEIAAFIADDTPAAVAKLEVRLADRPGMAPFTGTLTPGDIQFRVLAPTPTTQKGSAP